MSSTTDRSKETASGASKKTSAYNHVMKSTGLLGGVQAFYILMSVVRNKLTAMLIGTAGIGLADLYCRSMELLGNTTNFGIAFSAVRRLSSLYEEGDPRAMAYYVRLVRTWTFLTALFGALVCIAFSPLLSQLTTDSYDSIGSFCLLAPAVAFTTLAGGEIAILKGMRRLKHLALVSAAGALATVLLTIPLYVTLGMKGILPVIVATTATTFLLNLRASTRLFPYRISPLRKHFLRQGGKMLRLGSAYIAAGIIGSATELLIRTIIVDADQRYHSAGLYAAGLTLTVSYARLIFVAMDADYFPRLSAAMKDHSAMLELSVPDDMLMERLINRGKVSGRADDNEETITKRLAVYHSQTSPLIEWYEKEGKRNAVKGYGSLEEINAALCEVIDNL